MNTDPPVTEADLHAFVDDRLPAERRRAVEAYLARRPDEAQRIETYRAHRRELRALFEPVLDEPLPDRLSHAAHRPRTPWHLRQLAAGILIALVGGGIGWSLRGGVDGPAGSPGLARQAAAGATPAAASGFAQRAAVAHAVYSVDQRRAVEVDAAHEDQLIAWLSRRMQAPMRPPRLQSLGYALEGGRLLPGDRGPVAQFMYKKVDGDGLGERLTLYVSNEVGEPPGTSASATRDGYPETAFRFVREGDVNVFYWIDGPFGYALSADAARSNLAAVSNEVYRQLQAAPMSPAPGPR